jgi:hypothetical protein
VSATVGAGFGEEGAGGWVATAGAAGPPLFGAGLTSPFAGLSLGSGLARWRARGSVDRRDVTFFCTFVVAAFVLPVR